MSEKIKENKIVTNEERLPLKSDYVFKRVFVRDENNSMLKDLLEAILDKKIEKVVVRNPEIPKNIKDEKIGILDLKLEVDNTIIDVEMQMQNQHNMGERSSVYLSKLIAEQLKEGEQYNSIKKTITINILNFNYFKRNTYHSIAHMKFEKSPKKKYVDLGYTEEDSLATDKIEMHFIEIQKFRQAKRQVNSKLEQWLYLLEGKEEEKIKMAAEKNEEIKKTVKVLDELSMNKEERELYELRQKALMDYNTEMYYARKEGLEAGIKSGIEQGRKEKEREMKREIIIQMLKKNMNIKDIQEITGATKEQILKIRDEM